MVLHKWVQLQRSFLTIKLGQFQRSYSFFIVISLCERHLKRDAIPIDTIFTSSVHFSATEAVLKRFAEIRIRFLPI